jgi:amino acid transporter
MSSNASDSSDASPPNQSRPAEPVTPTSPAAPPPPAPTTGLGASFRGVGSDVFEATLYVSLPSTALERVKRFILGQPIPETLASHERLNKTRALATLSSDALSSVAYGTEASLAVLVAAGAGALTANLGIGLVTAVLMLIVGYSYRQTIYAYPSGGGSYIVARENLGIVPGLVAAAALLIDYLLTVSVSVASGIDAISSAFPVLSPAKVGIELGAIAFIMLINLRGIRESGTIFAFPTYFFLVCFGLTILAGLIQALTHGGFTAAAASQAVLTATEPVSTLLVLTAFASGCSAMTGVEAISNGVPAFAGRTPARQARNASQTLVVMVALLVTLFLGTTYLAWRVGAVAYVSGDPTVTSQIARFAFPGALGWFFYVVQAATLLILVFAANTSFADFPRLASILARDTYLPALFAYRGERIAFNVGIGTLGILSAVVLLIFRGNVVALINLYALGVFAAFTLSQSGMVVHWLRRQNEPGWRGRLVANGIGALATAVVTAVIAIAKFDRGAWVVVLLIPALVLGFLAISAYYHQPRLVEIPHTPHVTADVVFIPVLSHQEVHAIDRAWRVRRKAHPASERTWPRVLGQELDYAARIAPDIRIVQVVKNREEADAFCTAWDAYLKADQPALQGRVHTEALISPYRTVVMPLSAFLEWRQREEFAGKQVAVLLPRELRPSWWEWPLQRRIAMSLRTMLEHDSPPLLLVDLPYTLGTRR